MDRNIKLAKLILESNGYVVTEDTADGEAMRARHLAARQRRLDKQAAKQNKTNELIEKIKNSKDPISTAFEELVPDEGAAETVAGELVRAMMRLMYRDYNDGDVFYEGYGKETCLASAIFLCQKLDLFDDFDRAANMQLQDDRYTKFLEGIRDKVLNAIYDRPDLLIEKNTEDSLETDTDIPGVEEWEPMYEYRLEFTDDITRHIQKGDISTDDIMWNMEQWDGIRYGEIADVDDYGVDIVNLPRDAFDELESEGDRWMEQYSEELNSEYGTPDDDDEDYDEDEEEYEDEEDEDY